MKTKMILVLVSIVFATLTMNANGPYRGRGGYGGYARGWGYAHGYAHGYYAPRPIVRGYYGPAYYAPVIPPHRIWYTGYWGFSPVGVRIWIPGYWRVV